MASNPLAQRGKVYSNFDYGSYYNKRDNWYRNNNYQPPRSSFNFSPVYGLFGGMFLYWMLDHMGDKKVAATAYHHQDDPGFQRWRRDVEEQAKNNAELRAKLDAMDKQITTMKGTPKDAGYLPPGVPAEAALAPNVLASQKPEQAPLRFATGTSGGWYTRFGEMLKKNVEGIDVKLKTSGGSRDNLKLLADGEADMAIVQSDVLALMQPGKNLISEQSDLYTEYAQLIANRDSGIKSIKDVDPKKNVVIIGPKGSGTALSWEGLAEQSAWYRKIPTKYADYDQGLAEVLRNPKALMLFVGGLNSELIKRAEKEAKQTGKLRLVDVNDPRFAVRKDQFGNPIYKIVSIPSNVYPELQRAWFLGHAKDTLGVQAVLVLRSEWVKKYGPEAMDALSTAIQKTKPEIQKLVNAQ